MAKNERELLEGTIQAIGNFDPDRRSPYSLETFFFKLNDADRSKNNELWQKLRTALAQSREIKRKAPKAFFTRPSFSAMGYWWWDPSEWVVEDKAEG